MAPTHPWGPRKVARKPLNTVVALLYLKPAPVPTGARAESGGYAAQFQPKFFEA